MSENPVRRVRIRNQRNQPVELHCDGETFMLAPFAAAELDARVALAPQVATLERRRLLSVEALPQTAPPPAAAPESAPHQAAKKSAKKKPAARKNPKPVAAKKPAARKKSR